MNTALHRARGKARKQDKAYNPLLVVWCYVKAYGLDDLQSRRGCTDDVSVLDEGHVEHHIYAIEKKLCIDERGEPVGNWTDRLEQKTFRGQVTSQAGIRSREIWWLIFVWEHSQLRKRPWCQ